MAVHVVLGRCLALSFQFPGVWTTLVLARAHTQRALHSKHILTVEELLAVLSTAECNTLARWH